MASVRRLQRSADFERVLGQVPSARSMHFAVHHLGSGPIPVGRPSKRAADGKLSTAEAPNSPMPVDDFVHQPIPPVLPSAIWLGTVVPKRHARRSVTRSLIKRRIRAAVAQHAPTLSAGLWVVRLRAPFDVRQYPSAASDALQKAADAELAAMLRRVVAR